MDYRVGAEAQSAFAALSGDYNPLHMDPVAARRTMLGRQVVHGIHSCLRAIDVAARAEPLPAFRSLTARFVKPVFIGETVRLAVKRSAANCTIDCSVEGSRVAQFVLAEPAAEGAAICDAGEPPAWGTSPRLVTLDQAEGMEGRFPTFERRADLERAFPAALRDLGGRAIAVLLRLTRIVGMECPGHDSLFSSFKVTFDADPASSELAYRVAQVNRKIALVRLALDGAATGQIEAFFRPAVAPDPTAVPDHARPAPGEFAGRRALVVGGSRGLGRITALLMAAGGADVAVTYRVGREEAESVVEAVRRFGVSARALELDVGDPAAALAALAPDYEPTDLFYFATPHIFVRKVQPFEPALYRAFLQSYTVDFLNTVTACRSDALSVFYPSSVAVEEPTAGLAEYAAAKAAGERLCEHLDRAEPRLAVLRRRLPRLPTDQTATLMDVDAGDPYLTMLEICRDMRAGSPLPTAAPAAVANPAG